MVLSLQMNPEHILKPFRKYQTKQINAYSGA